MGCWVFFFLCFLLQWLISFVFSDFFFFLLVNLCSLKSYLWGFFVDWIWSMFFHKGFVPSSRWHPWALNIAWGLLVHTVESWPHTHKTSGSWLKTLKGGFSFPQLHLELRSGRPWSPLSATDSPESHWRPHHSVVLTFHVALLRLYFPRGPLVTLGYELLLVSAWHTGILMALAWVAVFRRGFALSTSPGSLGTNAPQGALTRWGPQ